MDDRSRTAGGAAMTASLGAEHYAAGPGSGPSAGPAVAALYADHALGLTRLALIMTGNRQAAEDIVQDAFGGLYRRWGRLREPDKALSYVRSAVLNGCRSEARRLRASLARGIRDYLPPSWSAESAALATEERREVIAALLRLPARQREALLLRYYLELSEAETAAAMRVSPGTAKSTVARGLSALRELLREES